MSLQEIYTPCGFWGRVMHRAQGLFFGDDLWQRFGLPGMELHHRFDVLGN
jgi:hypothetical protein